MELIEVAEGDQSAVHEVVAAAFGQNDEAELVQRLRADGDVVLELAAVRHGVFVGHILFSALGAEPSPRRIAALAPLCGP